MRSHASLALLAIVLLFWLQLFVAFVEATYSIGLLAIEVPPTVALAPMAFAAPLVLFAWRERFPHWLFVALAVALVACRLVEPHLDRMLRAAVAGFGVDAGLAWLPVWIERRGKRLRGGAIAAAAAFAVGGSALLRAAGSGIDASRSGAGQLVAAGLAVACLVLVAIERRSEERRAGGFGAVLVPCLGIACALGLVLYGFAAPAVMARWASVPLVFVLAVVGLSWSAALALAAMRPAWLHPAPRAAATAAFALLLAAGVWAHQPHFSGAYPFEPRVPSWGPIAFWGMLALSGVVPLALAAFGAELVAHAGRPRALAGAFALVGLSLLLFSAAQILTSIYDYAPVVGPLFRDRFWLVTSAPAIGMAAALCLSRARPTPLGWRAPLAAAALFAACAVAAKLVEPAVAAASGSSLRVSSYNVQQGFARDGREAFGEQLDAIESLDPDVVALQESDTARLAGENDDLVRLFAHRLRMHAAYGPSPVAGTFGVAILSRHPIERARTFYLQSAGEQTALLVASLRIGGRVVHVAVTHLGNHGPERELSDALAAIADLEPVVLVGDFNFVAGEPQHRLAADLLRDAWRSAEQTIGERLETDLDHAFVSPGWKIAAARYLRAEASDHPQLFLELE